MKEARGRDVAVNRAGIIEHGIEDVHIQRQVNTCQGTGVPGGPVEQAEIRIEDFSYGHDEHDDHDGFEHGQGDILGLLPFAGPVDHGGFVERFVNALDGCQINHHAVTDGFPHMEEYQEPGPVARGFPLVPFDRSAAEGHDVRFYGVDMQDTEYELRYVIEALTECGISNTKLEQLMDGTDYSDEFSWEDREKVFSEVRDLLLEKNYLEAAHYADVLIQNSKLSDEYENNPNGSFGLRDTLMAENVMWILAQEEQLGNKMIFICGHNGHMEQFGTYRGGNDKVMGNILADEVGSDAYFSIGTDFYKTTCNLPKNEKQRTTFTAYSHDPLAKAAYKSGNDICMLDFSKVPDDSSIAAQINGYIFMGSLGDQSIGGINRIVMRAIPYTYREWKNPHEAYDAMIFVSKAHPTKTRPKTGDTL